MKACGAGLGMALDEPHGDALAARAERALERLAPLEFEIAAGEEDRDAVLRMRYECVVAEGWARPEDHPDGRAREADDAGAIFVVCRDGGALAASMRIVAPTPGGRLPTERDFGVRARPQGSAVDVGRLVVAPAARAGRSHRIVGGLCARAWLETWARGYRRVISSATPDLIEFYGSLGMHVTVLGPARDHWGARRAPVAIEGDERSFAFLTG